MRIYLGGVAYHLVTIGESVEAVDRALSTAGLVFTRTATTVVWPGGRGEGVEFVYFVAGPDQRVAMDVVHHLMESGVWLLYRKEQATTPR